MALLERWRGTINLVGSTEWAASRLASRIEASLDVVPHLPNGLERLIDLGSGQGLPAIPIAIETGIAVELIEADRRKAAFLLTALSKLKLKGSVWTTRIEQAGVAPALCITAQALAPLTKLVRLARRHLQSGGVCLFLKGEGAEAEIALTRQTHNCCAELIPLGSGPACLVKVSALR